jgi:hypothetical protein
VVMRVAAGSCKITTPVKTQVRQMNKAQVLLDSNLGHNILQSDLPTITFNPRRKACTGEPTKLVTKKKKKKKKNATCQVLSALWSTATSVHHSRYKLTSTKRLFKCFFFLFQSCIRHGDVRRFASSIKSSEMKL